MARKKLKTRTRGAREADVAWGWRLRLHPDAYSQLLHALGLAVVTCALAVGVCVGFDKLEDSVHGMARYDRRLTLQWENLPDWLQLPENRHILDSLTRHVNLQESDRVLDRHLAERLARAVGGAQAGWIRAVERVTVHPNGVASIRCQFRRPTAWVRHGRYCYLVDEEGVRLPGCYDVADCRDSALMVIDGVSMPPPGIGRAWPGADLTSGLRLAALLRDKPFQHQIASIIVANHDGRWDRNRPHIELATDRESSRVWWGRPPDEEFGTEITASQKITLLETLYRQWGRIDMNRAYVNIMTWPDRITMPATCPAAKPRRLLRG